MPTDAETIAALESENAELKDKLQKATLRIGKLERKAQAKGNPATGSDDASAENGGKPADKKSHRLLAAIIVGMALVLLGTWAYNTYFAKPALHGWWISKAKEPWATSITGWLEPQQIHFMKDGKFEFYSVDGYEMRDICSATWKQDDNTIEITPTDSRGKTAKFTFAISGDILTLTNTVDKKETTFKRASAQGIW